ncbi:MAG: Smr/MutS family protein [bacterium]|nr:Smr/MutS family protein [bacterium]
MSKSHAKDPVPQPPRLLAPGDWVALEGMGRVGRVAAVDPRRKRARVDVGGQEWVLELRKLTPVQPPEDLRPAQLVNVIGAAGPILHEIDLHGMRVEEALALVDRALDQAVVNHLRQVKIIHGFGTGRVREAVRRMLATHHHVVHYHFGSPMEGGLGCTIAEIRPARP